MGIGDRKRESGTRKRERKRQTERERKTERDTVDS